MNINILRHPLRCFSARPNSSAAWQHRQGRDPFVQRAMQMKYRSRGAFKLLEIPNLLRPGQVVIDCGAAPGGWTQVAVQAVQSAANSRPSSGSESGRKGLVISIDRLHLDPIPGALLLTPCDFLHPTTFERVRSLLGTRKVDVVLSDMAPNMMGQRDADHENSMRLCRAVVQACCEFPLRKQGALFFKILQGAHVPAFQKELAALFDTVRVVKPAASRSESREIYMLCRGYQQRAYKN